jgi:chemotaxis protein MotB
VSDCPKCPPCKAGAPGWLATFSDLCTLLLTFFVLLLSFAKTESAKYEAAMGSVRNAFGGNVLKAGEVLRPGKSPDDAPTMIDSDQAPRPFPIEFLSSEGLLDKHEVNRDSDEQLNQMKKLLKDYELVDAVNIYEMPESITVRLKEQITFANGSTAIEGINIQNFEKVIKMLRENAWHILVEGHSALNERSLRDTKIDALALSSERAMAVARLLMQRGVQADRVTTVFYGDSRPLLNTDNQTVNNDRRVQFIIKKVDLKVEGKKVRAE